MLGVGALILIVVGSAIGGFRAVHRHRRRDEVVEPSIHPADLADLTERFAGIDADHARYQATLLELHLRPLVRRRIPVRSIECIPEQRTNRVRFADGTAVNVRGESPGDAGVLAAIVLRHAVLPGDYRTDASGTHLVFDWSDGRRHLSMLVTGLGQPD
jgi:hypothetical protein